jgi:hypothetical protein
MNVLGSSQHAIVKNSICKTLGVFILFPELREVSIFSILNFLEFKICPRNDRIDEIFR